MLITIISIVSFLIGFFVNGLLTWDYIFDMKGANIILHKWRNKHYKVEVYHEDEKY